MAKMKYRFTLEVEEEDAHKKIVEVCLALKALGVFGGVKLARPKADIFWKGDQPFIRIPGKRT